MAKGQEYNWERRFFRDEQTGVEITQLTGFPTISHAFYFHVQSFTPDSKTLLFLSYTELRRDATPNIFRVDVDGTNLTQLTDARGIESAVLAPDGRTAYYLVGGELHSLDINSGKETIAGAMEGVETWISGPTRLHLSDTGSISLDGKTFITGRRMADGRYVILHYRILSSEVSVIYRHPTSIAHVQFDPYTSDRIVFCTSGDLQNRNMWTLSGAGTGARILQIPNGTGHFAWLKNESLSKDKLVMSTVTSPRGAIMSCGLNDAEPKLIAQGKNFWHASPSRDGEWIISDTNWPDEGLQLVQVRTGRHKTLCYPRSSQGHPQWTHPHPFFSPDGKMVVFNSDRTGICQVYLAKITEEFLGSF